MQHIHNIADNDKRFVINPDTRVVRSFTRTVVAWMDHNSEYLTFEIPRYVEAHDISLCNNIEIHYRNYGDSGEKSGIYTVTDLQVDPTNGGNLLFTWLISQNATSIVGRIEFVVRFQCLEDAEILYSWSTIKCESIVVSESLYNTEQIVEQYADVLEQWKNELEGSGVNFETGENLELINDILSVKTTDVVEADNDLPVTSSGVSKAIENINPISHSWDGTTLSITTASGTTSADLKGETGVGVGIKEIRCKKESSNADTYEIVLDDNSTYEFITKHGRSPSITTIDYPYGVYPSTAHATGIRIKDYDGTISECVVRDGEDGSSVYVARVTESTSDSGVNTVTFSDGTRLNVKNGSKGSNGVSPHIGDNGNWWIGSTDTGVLASGTNGLTHSSTLRANLSIFEKFGVVGDSYASGAIYTDVTQGSFYNLSWGQIMARSLGTSCTNFSAGGLSTRTWLTHEKGLTLLLETEPQNIYYLMLGINDKSKHGVDYIGTIADIKPDFTQNADTFYGNYGKIIEYIKTHAPYAKIIMSTMTGKTGSNKSFNDAIEAIAEHFGIPCVKQYEEDFFQSNFYKDNIVTDHPTAPVYSGMANALQKMFEDAIVKNVGYFNDYTGNTAKGDFECGVEWDYSHGGTTLSRLGDAVMFGNPAPAKTLDTVGSSPFDDIMPWAGMKRCNIVGDNIINEADDRFSTENDTMVYIPPFFFKAEKDVENNKWRWYVRSTPAEGFARHPGSGRYIGRYHLSADYTSVSNALPATGMNAPTARANCHAKGDKWWMMDIATWSAVQLLYLVEFADFDSQKTLGVGQNTTSVINTGATDTAQYHTLCINDRVSNQYRWVENPFSNVKAFCDGFLLNTDYTVYLGTDNSAFNGTIDALESSGLTMPTAKGYISGFGYSDEFSWAFIPDALVDVSDDSICDYVTTPSSARIAIPTVGGTTGVNDKFGMWYADISSRETSYGETIGTRLIYIP